MYAFTRVWIGVQDATMQIGIMKVVSSTNGIETPSTPSLYKDPVREPVVLLDKLKARLRRVEAAPGDKAQHECDQRREQRDPARVSLGRLAISRQQQDEQRANQRQRQNAGEDPRAVHRVTPPNRYQVVNAAAPSSIAKA